MVKTALFLTFTFFIGYLLAGFRKKDSSPFFIFVPLYLSVGLGVEVILLFLVGLISYNISVLVLLGLGVVSCLFFAKELADKLKHRLYFRLRSEITPLILLSLSLAYFMNVVELYPFPTPGDAISHGMFTSLILYYNRVRPELNPYPLGFHVLSAFLSSFTGIYPGMANHLMAAIPASLIPSAVYSIAYLRTKSRLLPMLAYLSTYLVHPSLHLARWMFGVFYNGTYPVVLGLLFTITIFILAAETKIFRTQLSSIAALSLAIGLTYPNLIFMLIVPLTALIMKLLNLARKKLSKTVKRKTFYLMTLLLLIAVAMALYTATPILLRFLSSRLRYAYRGAYYEIPLCFLWDNINGYVMLFSPLFCLLYILLKRQGSNAYLRVPLFYMCYVNCLFVIFASFLVGPAYPIYNTTVLPSRSLWALISSSWVLLCEAINASFGKLSSVMRNVGARLKAYRFKIGLTPFLSSILLILFIVTYSNQFCNVFSFHYAQRLAWHQRWPCFKPDFEVMVWISENIPSEDTILNDLSFTSLFLNSLSIKDVVFTYDFHLLPVRQSGLNTTLRAIECKQVWFNPTNVTLIKHLIQKYKIRYIWVAAEEGYFDYWTLGGDNQYKLKSYSPSSYAHIFNRYPFLSPVFEWGTSKVYKVAD